MNKLFAYGCSYTYGDHLPDHNSVNFSKEECLADGSMRYEINDWPSYLSWPNYVAQGLGRTCENKGISGASNKQIWHAISNTNFNRGDIVMIMWTHPERTCIINEENEVDRIGIWRRHNHEASKSYYINMFNSADAKIETAKHIQLAHSYLTSCNIEHYNAIFNKDWLIDVDWFTAPILSTFMVDYQCDFGHDKIHPGPATHKVVAENFIENIKTKNYYER